MEKTAYLGVDEKYLRERWNEVREDFWGDLKRETLRALPPCAVSVTADRCPVFKTGKAWSGLFLPSFIG